MGYLRWATQTNAISRATCRGAGISPSHLLWLLADLLQQPVLSGEMPLSTALAH